MDNSSTISFQTQLPWGSHDFAISTLVSFHSTLVLVLLLAPLALATLKITTRKTYSNRAPLPPGPTPWPVIGNLPEIWKYKPAYRWIHDLMKQLDTGIACIRLANIHVIPVTSPEIAREFLKKYDSVFASRPLTMASELASRGFLSIILTPWGDQWKKMRRVVTSNLMRPEILNWLLHKRTQEADNLVRFIYNQCVNPEKDSSNGSVINLRLAGRQYTGNVIRRMMFNKRYFGKSKEDGGPGHEEEEHVESVFTVLIYLYSFALSDYVPWLRPLDLDGHEKIVSEALRIINGYHDPIIDERVQQWREGKKKEPEDWLDAFILAKNSDGKPALSVEEIKAQCTELMLATVDNPANAAEWAMAEMINQPETLQKAIEEIDGVVGKDRLVQEADIPKLNYVKACAREALRLHPMAAFNVPHVSNADTIVAGYFIPKGSHVLLSRVGLGRNPKVWDEPFKFKPERHFKDASMEVNLTETELRFISFTTGRRGCIGAALGTELTIMLLARLIHGFAWKVQPDEANIDLSEAKDDLFMATPLQAHCQPRLPAHLYPAN
ncbi:phenylalanine N-monooxygenase-like isoform X2 [Herrania umbratica]|uniref:Phenylalanine N-monooxygenase-like isoform X2 n=1 Tax=Herrania umbratica TaxID=108875 RepID=A0A6J1BCB8_9ROSI|nr:phenylalanine N-monooxygenase-like isoform X2 [Herrania umbratica]